YSGTQSRLLVPAATPLREQWQIPLGEWSTQTGGEATLEERAAGDLDRLTPRAGDAPAELAILSYSELPEVAQRLTLQVVPTEALADDGGLAWSDLMPGVRERLAAPRRRPLLLPLAAPVYVCYLRADLLQRAGRRPPQTWSEYHTLVEQLPEWAPGLTAFEPWGADSRATLFLAKALAHAKHPENFSVFVDLETLEPLIAGPPFVRAWEECRAVVRRLPAEVWQAGPLAARREVLEGRAALALAFEPTGGEQRADASQWLAQRASDIELEMVPLPGVTEVWNPQRRQWEGGTGRRGATPVFRADLTAFDGACVCGFAVAGRNERHWAPAWNLVATLAGPDYLSRLPPGFAGVTRRAQLADSTQVCGPELPSLESARYLSSLATVLEGSQLVYELPFPQRDMFRELLANALQQALAGEEDPAIVLGEVATGWSRLIDEIGRENFRRAYRQILGLGERLTTSP
ncbi:MAG: hypothetical protein ACKO3P_13580, partial [Planctomycetaceae bacterium]